MKKNCLYLKFIYLMCIAWGITSGSLPANTAMLVNGPYMPYSAPLFGMSCSVVQSPSGPSTTDGVIRVDITGTPDPPYQVQWNGWGSNGNWYGQITEVSCDPIFLSDLKAGMYIITVIGASSSRTCFINLPVGVNPSKPISCANFNKPECQQSILDILKDNLGSNPADNSCKQWEGPACSESETIYRTGSVGIGTQSVPSGFNLAVKGGIVTDDVIIELCEPWGWCDYVFDKDYDLCSLYEVEDYIKECGHLPGSVSQAEIDQNGGIELREVKLEQQEKIEEAFLHLINLNNQIKEIKGKIEKLRAENELLKNKK